MIASFLPFVNLTQFVAYADVLLP